MTFEGHVASGTGQGAYFLTLPWVQRELGRTLALRPFPGTLNLRVKPQVREALFGRRGEFLQIADPSSPECPGYLKQAILQAKGRRYEAAWLILPEQTMHRDIVEIIAPVALRESLDLNDGDPVDVEISEA
jgi:riboflavin kinase